MIDHALDRLTDDLRSLRLWSSGAFDEVRHLSYGDVKNNGVYYHPRARLLYSDLSGRELRHEPARASRSLNSQMLSLWTRSELYPPQGLKS